MCTYKGSGGTAPLILNFALNGGEPKRDVSLMSRYVHVELWLYKAPAWFCSPRPNCPPNPGHDHQVQEVVPPGVSQQIKYTFVYVPKIWQFYL
jgi:hypothetical protein